MHTFNILQTNANTSDPFFWQEMKRIYYPDHLLHTKGKRLCWYVLVKIYIQCWAGIECYLVKLSEVYIVCSDPSVAFLAETRLVMMATWNILWGCFFSSDIPSGIQYFFWFSISVGRKVKKVQRLPLGLSYHGCFHSTDQVTNARVLGATK